MIKRILQSTIQGTDPFVSPAAEIREERHAQSRADSLVGIRFEAHELKMLEEARCLSFEDFLRFKGLTMDQVNAMGFAEMNRRTIEAVPVVDLEATTAQLSAEYKDECPPEIPVPAPDPALQALADRMATKAPALPNDEDFRYEGHYDNGRKPASREGDE